MKKASISLLLLAPLLLVSSWVSAQAPATPDILYLKDGSMIRGTLIESIAGSHVRFKTLEGDVRQFPMSEVDRTTIAGKNNRPAVELKGIGYSHSTNLGVMIGNNGYYTNAGLSFQTINGIRIGHHWSAGIGTGIEDFNHGAQFPIFAHGRYTPLKGIASPYVDAMFGYAIGIKREMHSDIRGYFASDVNKGGVTAGIGAGVRLMAGPRFGLTIGMGYRFQRLLRTYTSSWWDGTNFLPYDVNETTDMHRIEVRFGITFQ